MSLTIPAVITRNANSLRDTDWRSLMDFFKKPGAPEAMVTYCEKQLGIDPEAKKKSIEEKELELTKRHEELEKEVDALAKEKSELATAQPETAAVAK